MKSYRFYNKTKPRLSNKLPTDNSLQKTTKALKYIYVQANEWGRKMSKKGSI